MIGVARQKLAEVTGPVARFHLGVSGKAKQGNRAGLRGPGGRDRAEVGGRRLGMGLDTGMEGCRITYDRAIHTCVLPLVQGYLKGVCTLGEYKSQHVLYLTYYFKCTKFFGIQRRLIRKAEKHTCV